MTYFTNSAKAKRKSGDNSFLANAARKTNNKPELPAMAKAIGMGIQPGRLEEPKKNIELDSSLSVTRNEAEKFAAKRNVRRASNRQLLSSSRLENLG